MTKKYNNTEQYHLVPTKLGASVYVPYVKVSFHTEKACYQTVAKATNKYGEALDPQNQLLAVSTQKSLDNPAGAFTIQLAGIQWITYLKPNDVVVIQMGYMHNKTLTTVMVGVIDTIKRTRSMSDTTPSISVTVTGRDFGKLLLKSQLKFYPEVGATSKANSDLSKFFLTNVGWVSMMSFLTSDAIAKGSPAVVIDNIMRFILPQLNDSEWAVYKERKGKKPVKRTVTAMEIIRYQLAEINLFLPLIMSPDQFEGSLWNLMERAAIKPFCELFIDVRSIQEASHKGVKGRAVMNPEETSNQAKAKLGKVGEGGYPYPAFNFGEDGAKVVLILRETPYDSKYKDNLVRHTIDLDDVISEELSLSDEEHYNLFWAGTTVNALGIDLKRVSPPLMNLRNVKKYGLMPLEVQIEGLEVLESEASAHGVALEGMSKAFTARLKAWYGNNHNLWSGQLTIRGKADIRIGHMINYVVSTRKMEFYVEGVSQTYNVFEGWETTLQITRGQTVKEKVDQEKDAPKPAKTAVGGAVGGSTQSKNTAKTHTVKKGDTLWALAGKYYGKNTDWRKIWDANRDMLIQRDKRNEKQHGHWIYPGQKLRIP